MEGTFQYSPFYPQAGSGVSRTRILSFTNDSPVNERGVPLGQVTLSWSLAGQPVRQTITPIIGNLSNTQRSVSLGGQTFAGNTTFTLEIEDAHGVKTATTLLAFVDPIFFGAVKNEAPTESEILGMNRRIALAETFEASIKITDEHSCFAAPMSTPICDVVETVFGLSVLGTYDIKENVPLTMADGLVVPYRVLVKKVPEHTLGQEFLLDVRF